MKLVDLERDPIWKVYEGLAAEAVEKVKTYRSPPRRFRASEMAKCRRQIWYRVAGFTPQPDEQWLRTVAESGDMHHQYVRQLGNYFGMGLTGFTQAPDGTQIEDKYVVRSFKWDGQDFDMSAQADAGMELFAPEDTVVEIKSMSHFAFDKINRAFIKGGQPAMLEVLHEEHENYIWQGNVTAMLLDKKYVYLFLVGRANNSVGVADVAPAKLGTWDPLRGKRAGGVVWEVEQADKENILQKAADIKRDLLNGEPPPPEYVDGSRECRQCPAYYLCHGAKKGYPVPGVVS
jgi:CRISPR/Cas system-associated exonuclease Cas4 (RecB family)